MVVGKRCGVGHFVRLGVDANVDVERGEHLPVFMIEIGDRLVLQPQAPRLANAGAREQDVAQKIKLDLQVAGAVGHR